MEQLPRVRGGVLVVRGPQGEPQERPHERRGAEGGVRRAVPHGRDARYDACVEAASDLIGCDMPKQGGGGGLWEMGRAVGSLCPRGAALAFRGGWVRFRTARAQRQLLR